MKSRHFSDNKIIKEVCYQQTHPVRNAKGNSSGWRGWHYTDSDHQEELKSIKNGKYLVKNIFLLISLQSTATI